MPIKGKTSEKHKDKFCLFHNANSHTISTCFDLKDEIEYLICRGKLAGYRKDADSGTRNLPNREIEGEIRTIAGGPYPEEHSQQSMKNYAREVRHKPSGGVFQATMETSRLPRSTVN